jgi:hypothetical protein
MFKVTFLDGTTQALSANVIAENMFAQVEVNQEGWRLMLLHRSPIHKRRSFQKQQID